MSTEWRMEGVRFCQLFSLGEGCPRGRRPQAPWQPQEGLLLRDLELWAAVIERELAVWLRPVSLSLPIRELVALRSPSHSSINQPNLCCLAAVMFPRCFSVSLEYSADVPSPNSTSSLINLSIVNGNLLVCCWMELAFRIHRTPLSIYAPADASLYIK